MSKITIFLQAFAVIASLSGIILTFSVVSEYDQDLNSIALQNLKIKEAEKNLAELRDKYASDQLRQKNRNLDLSEEIAELKKASDEIDVKLARTKEEIRGHRKFTHWYDHPIRMQLSKGNPSLRLL